MRRQNEPNVLINWQRQACRGTVPKVGALALRLRSSEIPTTHTITRSPMEKTQGNDKMKHRSNSYSQNTHSERGATLCFRCYTQTLLAVSIRGEFQSRWEAACNDVRESHGFWFFLPFCLCSHFCKLKSVPS